MFEEATIMSGAVLALGLGIGIALIGALVVARRVSRPLALIQGALAQVSQGNLDVKLELASKDEFGSVAGTLLEMVQGLILPFRISSGAAGYRKIGRGAAD
ncbi:MAG: hypothetical protein DCC75_09685 [Proteobacteria bacterium]|nr:MAG: hypothetical protein DCC75_09685 [Pseudomonadota bacterium]